MLLDLQLPDGSGIEVCRAVRSVKPSVSGLLLTAAADDVASAAAVLAGAAGHLVKVTRSNDIVSTIRNQQPGKSQLDACSVEQASDSLRSVMQSLAPPATETERRVLEHVLHGRTDSEILEGMAEDDHPSAADVVAFVTRMTQALLGGGPAGTPVTGRHRRSD